MKAYVKCESCQNALLFRRPCYLDYGLMFVLSG